MKASSLLSVGLALLTASSVRAGGLFGAKVDYLLQVTNDNKDEELLEQAQPALIAFVAPWCGHCKALVQPFKKAAKKLKAAEFKFGFVDCDVDNDFCQSYKVKGFPSIKAFSEGKAEDYGGARSEDAFIAFANEKISGAGGGGGGGGGAASTGESKLAPTITYSKMWNFLHFSPMPCVLYLDKEGVDGEEVSKHGSLPSWFSSAAMGFKEGKVKKVSFGYVHTAAEPAIAKRFGVTSLPAVLVLDPEKDAGGQFTLYDGELEGDGVTGRSGKMKEFVEAFTKGTKEVDLQPIPSFPPPERPRKQSSTKLYHLRSEAEAKERCFDLEDKMCVLYLVDDLDAATGKFAALEAVRGLSKKYKNDPFHFCYASRQSQPDLVEAFGTPTLGGDSEAGSDDDRIAAPQSASMTVIKFGKRTRYATAGMFDSASASEDGMGSVLDKVLGGDLQFKRIKSIPFWEGAKTASSDEE